jgi:D-xylulose reductase
MAFAATPPYDGTLGRFYLLPADLAHRLGDNMSLEDGAMVGHKLTLPTPFS